MANQIDLIAFHQSKTIHINEVNMLFINLSYKFVTKFQVSDFMNAVAIYSGRSIFFAVDVKVLGLMKISYENILHILCGILIISSIGIFIILKMMYVLVLSQYTIHMLRNFNVHYGNTSQFGCLQTKQNLLPNKWQKSINNETKPSFSMNFWFNL